MSDADELDKLVRLRDSGVLTQEEFQQAKMRLLTNKNEIRGISALLGNKRNLITLVSAAVFVFALILFLQPATRSNATDIGDEAGARNGLILSGIGDNVQPSADLKSKAIERQDTNLGEPMGSYAWATSPDRMFENPDYIQEVLGTPQRRSSDNLFYNLGGCWINFIINDFAISGIQMGISDQCEPKVGGRTITSTTTFGDVYESGGFLMAACLRLCGNRADPTIDYVIPGPHANAFIGVSYSTIDTAQSEVWENEIARNLGFSDVWDVPSEKFLCPPKPSPATYEAMKDATISNVTIKVDAGDCPKWFE